MYGTVTYVGLLNVAAIIVLLTNFMGQSHFLKNKSCPASRKKFPALDGT